MLVQRGPKARRYAVNVVALVALVTASLSGCGTADPAESTPWPASSEEVARTPLVWESFGRVHLADDTVVDLGPAPRRVWTVAGPGVWWFTPGGTLTLSTTTKRVESEVTPWWTVLSSSPDGRWVVYVEVTGGVPEVVTLDTRSGRVTSRTDVGLTGADVSEHWRRELAAAKVGVIGFSGHTVYFRSRDHVHGIDMTSGDSDAWLPGQAPEGTPGLDRGPSTVQAPWRFTRGGDRFIGAGKDEIRLRTPGSVGKAALLRWTGAGTAAALWRRPGRADTLLSCRTRSGACHLVLGTEEGFTLPRG